VAALLRTVAANPVMRSRVFAVVLKLRGWLRALGIGRSSPEIYSDKWGQRAYPGDGI